MRLQNFSDRILQAVKRGGPLTHTGQWAEIMNELSERRFIVSQIEEALSAIEKEG